MHWCMPPSTLSQTPTHLQTLLTSLMVSQVYFMRVDETVSGMDQILQISTVYMPELYEIALVQVKGSSSSSTMLASSKSFSLEKSKAPPKHTWPVQSHLGEGLPAWSNQPTSQARKLQKCIS